MASKDEKQKALEAALGQIEKQYGKGAVMKLGDHSHMQVETVPTGSFRENNCCVTYGSRSSETRRCSRIH